MFTEAISKAPGMESELESARTVIVPTNEAFERLGHTELKYLMNNSTKLQKVLLYLFFINILCSIVFFPWNS